MKLATRLQNNLSRTLLLLVAMTTWDAAAHIVPPEQFHPVAEAYRRLTFMVNLNPVLWDKVQLDVDKIGAGLQSLKSDRGESYFRGIREAITELETEASISLATPTMRKKTARRIFELSTTAVAEILVLHLEAAGKNLPDYAVGGAAFDVARQVWAAFEHEVRATDREMFRVIGRAWLECSSAMGSPGMAGLGSIPPDRERFEAEVGNIIDYVRANFGPGFSAHDAARLVALPLASDTFDKNAMIPVKLPPGSEINKQLPRPRQILNMAERGVNELDTTLIALGDMAFDSPYIFGEPARSFQLSCNTCHNKGVTNPNFFIPGMSNEAGSLDVTNSFFAPHANNGHFDALDIPDLRGIRFTAPYGRNGRFASLREFTRNVIVNEFNGAEPSPALLDAMIAYMNEFDFLPNRMLNDDGTLSEEASASAHAGEKIFNRPFDQMNGMSCATCHIPSSQFADGNRHDIGSAQGSSVYSADGALDTPTLLSSRYSQPYFHDGSLPTLGSVVEWFDGRFKLELTSTDKANLTAYLETVGDGEESYEDTMFTLEAEMEEFSFFLSAYEFAKQLNDQRLVGTILQTISLEIEAHKWDVQDQNQLPTLTYMAELMDRAYVANAAGDSKETDALIAEYRKTYEENAEFLR